jgi:hypothetical protein
MALWNLPDGGLNYSEPLLGPFEYMQGGTLSTNPHHLVASVTAWSNQNRYSMVVVGGRMR